MSSHRPADERRRPEQPERSLLRGGLAGIGAVAIATVALVLAAAVVAAVTLALT